MGGRIEAVRARRAAIVVVSATLILMAGCGASSSPQPVAHRRILPRDRWSFGREVFRIDCASCHTLADAGAHGRRSDLDSSSLASSPRALSLARDAVIYGAPGMPKWRITLRPEELHAVIGYVAAVAGKPVPPRPPVPTIHPPARRDRFTYARALFDELCAGCHSLADAGAHTGPHNMDETALSISGQRRKLASTVMKIGYHTTWRFGGMPSYKGVLSEREFDALVAYISTVAGRPGALTPPAR